MPTNPVAPNGFKIVRESEPCPECGATCTVKIGQQTRCNQCGHQWPPVQPVILGPSRRDVLNGAAFPSVRIIRFR
jgi:hypothetical protein